MKDENMVIHFIGIGGIGMSGLAQMYKELGFTVTGSDRGYGKKENEAIFAPLEKQGIKIYPQDGAYYKDNQHNLTVVYSTAIEKTNPDIIMARENNISLKHRSEALAEAIKLKCDLNKKNDIKSIAIAGSCGKTTVSSYTAEMLKLITKQSSFLSGGIVNRFATDTLVGNYYSSKKATYFVFEADESDKSLINYNVDYAIILNAENDHYPREELLKVFKKFIKKIRHGLIIEYDLYQEYPKNVFKEISVKTFSKNNKKADFFVTNYTANRGEFMTIIKDNTTKNEYNIKMINPGLHNASNICSIMALFSELKDIKLSEASKHFSNLKGAWRRFNYRGKLATGAKIFDDYAHNVSKLQSCLQAAREATSCKKAKIYLIFQPHGYGPLKIMQNELLAMLHDQLNANEFFYFLPVYYAGGTTSFTPKSKDVVKNYYQKNNKPKNIEYIAKRSQIASMLKKQTVSDDIIIIAGARDNSLATWGTELSLKK